MQEKDNIKRILEESILAIEKGDSYKLKILSDQTIHSVTIYQDPDNIIIAVLIYSVGKILERENYKKMEGWNLFYNSLVKGLKLALKALEKEDLEEFRALLGKIRNSINKIEGSLKDYINDVFYKAGVNKAFKVYEHGLSSEKTAQLLGVSLWDLSSYIGQSTVAESKLTESVPVHKRIKLAEKFFK